MTVSGAFSGAFAGRRVLVTGDTGFKGAWLAFWLTRLGAEVHGLSLAPEGEPNLFSQLGLGNLIRSRRADLRSFDAVEAALRETRPEAVFHLAAQPLVRLSYDAPVETFAVNVMGTAHVAEASRRAGSVRALVSVTTDKVYRDPEAPRPRTEEDPLGGHDPYSSSKAAAEIAAASFRLSYSMPLATARAGNVIGGGDWAKDRILPDCIRAFAASAPAVVRNPASVRPWQHVLEPLSGYLCLGAALLGGKAGAAEAWNFGPSEDSVPVSAVADAAAAAWGDGASWKASGTPGPHEAAALRLDSAKARKRLGWAPVWDHRRAISESISWYKASMSSVFDARALTAAQIELYRADAAAAGAAWA
ncbi:MAG: CDP-glucose 4,6-dehydratase [Elusimicrobia bacterium]|nr:CDP-glucose 4,6-dehydratase [Elusimicrobiota bacterium]